MHRQFPVCLEGHCVVPLRFEIALLDPGDDTTIYLELRVRNLELREEFYGLLPLDTARRLRD